MSDEKFSPSVRALIIDCNTACNLRYVSVGAKQALIAAQEANVDFQCEAIGVALSACIAEVKAAQAEDAKKGEGKQDAFLQSIAFFCQTEQDQFDALAANPVDGDVLASITKIAPVSSSRPMKTRDGSEAGAKQVKTKIANIDSLRPIRNRNASEGESKQIRQKTAPTTGGQMKTRVG